MGDSFIGQFEPRFRHCLQRFQKGVGFVWVRAPADGGRLACEGVFAQERCKNFAPYYVGEAGLIPLFEVIPDVGMQVL